MMAKKTAKYVGAAVTAVSKVGLSANHIRQMENQEELYSTINKAGYHWNSKIKEWEYHELEDANEPTPLIMIRVWADAEIVEEVADDVVKGVKRIFQLVERSTPYPCRPPKQLESRVYLKFMPRVK